MAGFTKMKRNKSSEVIPLRPHISDAKQKNITDLFTVSPKDDNAHHVIFHNFPLKLEFHCVFLSNKDDRWNLMIFQQHGINHNNFYRRLGLHKLSFFDKRLHHVSQTSVNFKSRSSVLSSIEVKKKKNLQKWKSDLLIEDQVWGKVEHGAVSECVGPPAQSEHHHPHPWQLNHWHLIIHMQVTETW